MAFSKKSISLFLFIIVSINYVFFRVVENEELMYVFKPLVIFTLAVHYLISANRINRLYILVLVFQLIGDFIFVKEDMDSFMLGIGFFFMINILLSLIITNRIGIINPKDIFRVFIPVSIIILAIVYVIFASVGFIKVLVLTFTLTVAVLLSASVKYYAVFKRESSKWMPAGVILTIVCYISAGAIRLIKPNVLFSVLESSTYCFSVYCYSRFIVLEEYTLKTKHL